MTGETGVMTGEAGVMTGEAGPMISACPCATVKSGAR